MNRSIFVVFDNFCLGPEVSLLFEGMILPKDGRAFLKKYGELFFSYAQMDIVRINFRIMRSKRVKLQPFR